MGTQSPSFRFPPFLLCRSSFNRISYVQKTTYRMTKKKKKGPKGIKISWTTRLENDVKIRHYMTNTNNHFIIRSDNKRSKVSVGIYHVTKFYRTCEGLSSTQKIKGTQSNFGEKERRRALYMQLEWWENKLIRQPGPAGRRFHFAFRLLGIVIIWQSTLTSGISLTIMKRIMNYLSLVLDVANTNKVMLFI